MESAIDRYQRILAENNLTATLQDPKIRMIENGGVIVEKPLLKVDFLDMAKEVVTNEPSPTPVAQETQDGA